MNQLLLSAKLGDGGFVTQRCENPQYRYFNCLDRYFRDRYSLSLVSVNLDYIVHKKVELEKMGMRTGAMRIQKSGYKPGNTSYVFRAWVNDKITEVGKMSKLECIKKLSLQGLIYYYLDDGTYHKNKHCMHLYCNTFKDFEVEALIEKVYELYPIKRCTLHLDRKKDGRQYPYLYVPTTVAKALKEPVLEFLTAHDITTMLYKVGLPSTTIERVSE